MKKLPIGIQSFEEIATGGYYYVDKTYFVAKLSNEGKYYFLSRPRRFGKSLFLDTIKQAFLGKRELFKGLYLYDNWDWSQTYPVLNIDFGGGLVDDAGTLEKWIKVQIGRNFENLGISANVDDDYRTAFEDLILKAQAHYKHKVVILIDEYDKPILDRIDNIEKAIAIRDVLKNLYSVIKPLDAYIKLVFLTGVSRFSKVSIFSGLNQLNDITLDPDFATLCGYTQSELETVFENRVKDFDKEALKVWYNGYSWLGERVYNPFDILLLFSKKMFRPYWFETGTPTFLIKLFQKNAYYVPKLEELKVGEELLSNLDIDYIFPENLLFQSGYLTIKDVLRIDSNTIYVLTYPNLEVRKSFNDAFLTYLTPDPVKKDGTKIDLLLSLREGNIDKIKDILYSFFASFPVDWYRKNNIQEYEGYYASVVYALLNGAGLTVVAEDTTTTGRIDLTVLWNNRAYIVEFKVVEDKGEGKALQQIKEKRYYEKYKNNSSEIYIIGIEFSKEQRNIVFYQWERM
ncbi:MAG: ATP-binding protein [Spirochaetota bacterium]